MLGLNLPASYCSFDGRVFFLTCLMAPAFHPLMTRVFAWHVMGPLCCSPYQFQFDEVDAVVTHNLNSGKDEVRGRA